jgi:hypothetical protein
MGHGVGARETIRMTGPINLPWSVKFAIAVAVDLLDFTVGRLLFPAPFSGEVVGAAVAFLLFGWKGLFYLVEILDPTEQIDGFVPTCTLIALAARDA